jgi:hypothetical protein
MRKVYNWLPYFANSSRSRFTHSPFTRGFDCTLARSRINSIPGQSRTAGMGAESPQLPISSTSATAPSTSTAQYSALVDPVPAKHHRRHKSRKGGGGGTAIDRIKEASGALSKRPAAYLSLIALVLVSLFLFSTRSSTSTDRSTRGTNDEKPS